VSNAFKLFQAFELPYNVEEVINDHKASDASQTHPFWVQAAALKQFVTKTGYVPL